MTPPATVGGNQTMNPVAMNPGQVGTATEKVPCNVASVVSTNCSGCHGSKLVAPMPLLTLADFHAMAKSNTAKQVYEIIPDRINNTMLAKRMPPASQNAIAAPDLQAFNTWLSAGAKGAADGCDITTMAAVPGNVGAAGTGGEIPTTGEMGASGGAHQTKIEYNDPEMTCYEFTAHAQGDFKAPYMVTTTPDQYTNFMFMPPWQGTQYVRSFEAIAGNPDAIHHWLLYKDAAAGTDGDISPSSGAHPDGELQDGWAPGGSDLFLDPDVGILAPSDVAYTLETHHNNITGSTAPDASGVRVCVTPKVPKFEASLSWLGTDNINGTEATGTCAPTSTEPIHILGATPHMHTKGIHMKVVIDRAGGMQEVFHDHDFDFGDQHSFGDQTIIMPGDTLTTTCSYNAPASFGERTSDEMCYFFTLYYPKLSLTNGNIISNVIHGPNTCLN